MLRVTSAFGDAISAADELMDERICFFQTDSDAAARNGSISKSEYIQSSSL
jgi:hypothetical protein